MTIHIRWELKTMQAQAHHASELVIETHGRVRKLILNRPERLNALSWSLYDALIEAFLDARSDPNIWVIVVTATGTRAFCAGMDLKDVRSADGDARPFRGPMDQPRRLLFEVIGETYKPVIAAINGTAVGGGFEIALACDIRLAAEGVELSLPEAKIGMGAIYGSVVLPRFIPIGAALEKMFTGDSISANDAVHWGLINQILPPESLQESAMRLAQRIAENAPITVRRMKEMAMKGLSLPVATALRLDVGPNPYSAEDRQEGIRAFLEKRKPQWKGR